MKEIKINLDVEINRFDIVTTIFQSNFPIPGSIAQLYEDKVAVKLLSYEEGLGFTDSILIELLLSFGMGVASGIVANAIYNSFGKGTRRLTLGGMPVRIDIDELEKALDTIRQFRMYIDSASEEES